MYPLVEATLYLATAPKSNSATCYFEVMKHLEEHGIGPVPLHLMDASRDARGFGHGKGYQYPHMFPDHFISQQYLPDSVVGQVFYHPSDQGREKEIAARLKKWRQEQVDFLAKRGANKPIEN
jgi:putative ATPase